VNFLLHNAHRPRFDSGHVVEERTIVGKQKDKLSTSELPPDLAAAQEVFLGKHRSAHEKGTM
jgi:hypothetical protein